jgi:hypothetical protein
MAEGLCADCYQNAESRRLQVIELAREQRGEEGAVEIDDCAELSEGNDNGCYVRAWVWVDFDGTKFNKLADEGSRDKCDACRQPVSKVIGCPDGSEICQDCFDAGQH